MIIPRAWIPKAPLYDIGQRTINDHIRASKPEPVQFAGRLFHLMSTAKRRSNAYKNAGTRMAEKFAQGV